MRAWLFLISTIVAPSLWSQTGTLPRTNALVLEFVEGHYGKRVGRGECWDLAAQALNAAHARWDGQLEYGRLLDHTTEEVLAGDIIQLEEAEFRWEEAGAVNGITMPHHTVVVTGISSPGVFTIAHQNMEGIGRKVGPGELVLSRLIKGRVLIYRPVGD